MNDAGPLQAASRYPLLADGFVPLFSDIAAVIQQSRGQLRQAVNGTMVQCYWQIGRLIVEHEQHGQPWAAYGKQQLQGFSAQLTQAFGKGFDASNLRNMRRFYLTLPSEAELKCELERERIAVQARLQDKTDGGNDA